MKKTRQWEIDAANAILDALDDLGAWAVISDALKREIRDSIADIIREHAPDFFA